MDNKQVTIRTNSQCAFAHFDWLLKHEIAFAIYLPARESQAQMVCWFPIVTEERVYQCVNSCPY